VPTTIILTSALLFVGIVYLSIKVNVDISEKRVTDPLQVLQKFIHTPLGLLDILLRVGIQYFSFPFQFYIGKEFFFILYDEIKYRSISKKIDEIKMYTSHRGVYTEDMVTRVDNETYELVRQPYMKHSSMKYYGISTLLYLINLIFAISMMFSSQANSILLMTSVNELFLLWKSPI